MILPNNTRVQNRYLIVRLLAKGGFGAVYEARHLGLGHRVALKQLTLAGPQVLKAFEREARILARLKHPALPKVSDYFVDSNAYFLVMDYIEGDDFKALLAQRTAPFSVSQVLEWADQLLDGLDYLHHQQPPVIHRDIKPANIKLSPAGKVYLLDFGISKGGQTHTNKLASGRSIRAFSPNYAPMEQVETKRTNARSDLYSLAVTLHHLLSQQEPPRTVTRAHALAMNKPDPLRPVNELNPQVPIEVAQVLTSALNFDPNLRPESAHTMRQMLKDAIPQRQAPPPRPIPPIYEQPTKPSTLHALPFLLGLGILLLLVGIAGASVLFGGTFDPSKTANDLPVAIPTLSKKTPATEIVVAAVATGTPLPTNTSLATITVALVPTATLLPTETPVPPTPELVADAMRISEKDNMVQVYVPEGDFEMGSADDELNAADEEKPRHTVYLDAFFLDQTEIKNEMFARFVEQTGHQTDAEKEGWGWVWDGSSWQKSNGAGWQHPLGPQSNLDGLDDHPVVQVSWNDANAYCQWAERRLPTEAEWEKAAGGTDGRKWPWGNEMPTCEQAQISGCEGRTVAVGTLPAGASPYGALDMAGNVWEWVFDSYDSNYYISSPRENPTGPSQSVTKVIRGGSWFYSAPATRVRSRLSDDPVSRAVIGGFRCASSP